MRKLLLLIGVGGLGLGTFLYYRKQVAILKEIEWKIKNVKINHLSTSDAQLLTTMEVVNNADISFTITGYDVDIFVNDKKVANVVNRDISVKLPRMGVPTQFNFLINVKPSELGLGNLISQVFNSVSTTTFKVVGRVSVKKGIFTFNNQEIDLTWNMEDIL
jgi:hypothetical protein